MEAPLDLVASGCSADPNNPLCQAISASAPVAIPNGYAVTYEHFFGVTNLDLYLLGFNLQGEILFNTKVNTTPGRWSLSSAAVIGDRIGVVYADITPPSNRIQFCRFDTFGVAQGVPETLLTNGTDPKLSTVSNVFVIGLTDSSAGGLLKFRDPGIAIPPADIALEPNDPNTALVDVAGIENQVGILYASKSALQRCTSRW